MWGGKYEPGTCYFNKGIEGPEGCARPAPPLDSRSEPAWKLFRDTSGLNSWRGMDGEPTGRLFSEAESLAHARRIPWDETTTGKLLVIQKHWLAEWRARNKKEK